MQAALGQYQRFKQGAVPGYRVNENTLNQLGYVLLREKKFDDALKVFKLNVEEYPNCWNCFDSLGEGYMIAGQKELAIRNYEKSMEMNPQNTNGADMLKKLRGEQATAKHD
jgi:tetratricopeptide (TPR) repeat protein